MVHPAADWLAGELLLDPDRPLPPIPLRRPPGLALPSIGRLTMVVERAFDTTEVYADALLPPEEPTRFVLEQVHIEPDARPGDPAVLRAPWPQAVERLEELIGNARELDYGTVRWRLELLHPDGTPAAASAAIHGRYRLQGS